MISAEEMSLDAEIAELSIKAGTEKLSRMELDPERPPDMGSAMPVGWRKPEDDSETGADDSKSDGADALSDDTGTLTDEIMSLDADALIAEELSKAEDVAEADDDSCEPNPKDKSSPIELTAELELSTKEDAGVGDGERLPPRAPPRESRLNVELEMMLDETGVELIAEEKGRPPMLGSDA